MYIKKLSTITDIKKYINISCHIIIIINKRLPTYCYTKDNQLDVIDLVYCTYY